MMMVEQREQEKSELLQTSQAGLSQEGEVLVEDSLALMNEAKKGSEESEEALVARLAAQSKKIISVEALSEDERLSIRDMIELLAQLRLEVVSKKESALQQSEGIKGKVNNLVQSGKVQIDQAEYERSASSVLQYAALLENIVGEIDAEIGFFGLFFHENAPKRVVVWQTDPDRFTDFLVVKIRYVKKYVKNIRKDLNVSYSRYVFGFRAQAERIMLVEAYIRHLDQAQQQVQEKAQLPG